MSRERSYFINTLKLSWQSKSFQILEIIKNELKLSDRNSQLVPMVRSSRAYAAIEALLPALLHSVVCPRIAQIVRLTQFHLAKSHPIPSGKGGAERLLLRTAPESWKCQATLVFWAEHSGADGVSDVEDNRVYGFGENDTIQTGTRSILRTCWPLLKDKLSQIVQVLQLRAVDFYIESRLPWNFMASGDIMAFGDDYWDQIVIAKIKQNQTV